MRAVAKARGTPIYVGGEQWQVREEGEAMAYEDATGVAYLPKPELLGAHQIRNAGNAIAAVTMLHEYHIGSEHIEQALLSAKWLGRLEQIPMQLPDGFELWFDGGHNIGGAQAISDYIHAHWQDDPVHLIFGSTQGKDVVPMLVAFRGLIHSLHLVPVRAEPSSHSAKALMEKAREAGFLEAQPHATVLDAIEKITQSVGNKGKILVLGSLFFRAELAY